MEGGWEVGFAQGVVALAAYLMFEIALYLDG